MLTRVNLEDVPRSARRNNRPMKELDDFHKSDWPAAEIDVSHYKSVSTAANAYRQSIKKCHLGLDIVVRRGRAYVLRRGADDMAKNRTYSGGKHSVGKPTLGKEAMLQLIRKCSKANKQAAGKHEYGEVLKRYCVTP